jgi:hypothetical protein
MSSARFETTDLQDQLPEPGYYKSTISTARFRTSQSGNRMIQVVYAVSGVAAGHDRVAEYFVVDAASHRGRVMARRRLVELYRACGLEPRDGDEIAPVDLVDAVLEIKIEHDQWQGQTRLRVVAHRRAGAVSPDGSAPF